MAVLTGNIVILEKDGEGGSTPSEVQLHRRLKTEVSYRNVSVTIPTTFTSLFDIISGLTPSAGKLYPFFNTQTKKLNLYNCNESIFFKLNIVGVWEGGSGVSSRSMEMDFTSTEGNRLFSLRDTAQGEDDIISFLTFMSVDIDGNLVRNGSPIMIRSNGKAFVAKEILIVAEQQVPSTILEPSVV